MKENMINWFKRKNIKSIIENLNMEYNIFNVQLCIDYIQNNEIKYDENLDVYCASLYFNILKLYKITGLDCEVYDKKKYKKRIKDSWKKHLNVSNE